MTVDETSTPQAAALPVGRSNTLVWRFGRQRLAVLGSIFLVALLVAGLAAPWFAPHDPNAQDLRNVLASPLTDGHLLGTDELGRDVFSRLVYAIRISAVAVAQAVGMALLIGVPFGLVAGMTDRAVAMVVMRITDIVMAFPPIILAIAIIAVLGPDLTNAMIALGLVFAPRVVRLTRSSVSAVRHETYIEASRTIGTGSWRLMFWHVLPNVRAPLIIQTSILAGVTLLAEAGLSFLGLGVQPPNASWGTMMRSAFDSLNDQNLLILWPGGMIMLTVLAFNVVGDGLRDSFGREVHRGDR
ncbi:ABC transporter permease [Ilumatobacter nonamiensis]|uniref:ABC transporter permease n=1 Tax=Ilumatobacter nonamiensis TaxID=467093 RepID=UPI00058FC281|nr:ABC transporter permease [Ilumatobacter nonamiensis]